MQTKYAGRPKWSDMADELYDSDCCRLDGYSDAPERLIRCMQEFRDHGCITGFWFSDGQTPPDESGRVPDSWHDGELRDSSDCGPTPDDIDFAGLP